jgi:hypothetical protein
MFTALREVQIPVLAVMLLGGCAAKAWRALHSRSAAAGMDATGLVPLHLRRPAVVMLFMAEALLGLGLIGTAGRLGDAARACPPPSCGRRPRCSSSSPWAR